MTTAEPTYIFLPADDAPSEVAMNAWYDKTGGGSDMAPRITVHNPTSLPQCYIDRREHGCHEPATLPKGSRWCSLRIGGIEFRMQHDDARLMIQAAAEAIEHAAWCVADLKVDEY